MSALSEMAADAGGALTGQLWKVITLLLLVVLLVGGGAGGVLWWSAASARDKALADLLVEKGVTAQLRAGVDDQNRAIRKLGEDALAAEERGRTAQALAAANGRRFDNALAGLAGAKATTCAEAMPYVNQLLEKVR